MKINTKNKKFNFLAKIYGVYEKMLQIKLVGLKKVYKFANFFLQVFDMNNSFSYKYRHKS